MNNFKNFKKDIIFVLGIFSIMVIYFFRLMYDTDYLDIFDHSMVAHGLKQSYLELFHGRTENFVTTLSYPGWHLLFCIFYRFFRNDNLASGLTNSFFITLESIVLLWGFRKNEFSVKKSYLYTILMIFVGPLFLEVINKNYYLGQLPANIWHNPTIISVKPFMLFSLFLTIEILIDEEINKKNFIELAVCMLISCFFKPSFMQMYGLALVIFCIAYTIVSKGIFLKKAFAFAIACIPSALAMIMQFLILYAGIFNKVANNSNVSNNAIGISFLYVWGSLTNNVLGSLLLSIAFPMCIYIFLCRETLSKPLIQLGIAIFISGVGCFSFFYNVQTAFQADFAWGAYLAIAAVFVLACIGLERLQDQKLKYRVGFIILCLHFLCGFIYWINVYIFRSYDGGLFRLFFERGM